MKSKVKNTCTNDYPRLMKSTVSDVVVLFSSFGVGTVVHGRSKLETSIGECSDDWYMGYFTDFDGVVELSN